MDGDDEDWEEDDAEETALEGYSTIIDDEDNPVDEYQIFKAIFQTIQNRNPVWYQALTHGLNEEQRKQLQDSNTRFVFESQKRFEKVRQHDL